jgi:hypothetical protein
VIVVPVLQRREHPHPRDYYQSLEDYLRLVEGSR